MAQLAIWTFDTLSGVGSGTFLSPTAESVFGVPSLQMFFQDIDNNGKGGTAYTDANAVVHAAGSAAAWNDIKGDGDDAEFRVTLDTRGYTDLSLRLDIRADSADNFDLQYSVDGGFTFVTAQTNVAFAGDDAFHTVSVDMTAINAIENAPYVIFRFSDFSQDGNNNLRFDNLEITGTQLAPAPNTPTIAFDDANTTDFLSLTPTGRGFVNGSIGDATDPASVDGIAFAFTGTLGGYTFTATSSNQAVVADADLQISATGPNGDLVKIVPHGVGETDITLTVSNPGGGSASYVVSYFASAQATDAANTHYHSGTTDGSAAIAIDANYMLNGNDENQVIGVYDRNNSGMPVKTFDFATNLGLPGQPREVDIEDATRVGNRIYWMGSQSNNSSGDDAPNRDTIFSTDLAGTGTGTTLTYVNKYSSLEADLVAWDHNNVHGLGADHFGFQAGAGAGGIPETTNGFNIEGLTMAPGSVTTAYVSFRAPLVDVGGGQFDALIVPVTNFTTIVDTGAAGGSATFGAPILLDLGGRGIRSIETDGANHYLILAGPPGGANGAAPTNFALYTWDGVAADAPVLHTANLNGAFADFGGSPEAIVAVPSGLNANSQIQILIDDGDTVFYNNGVNTKDTPQATLQKFVSEYVTLGGTTLDVTIDQAAGQGDPTTSSPVDFTVVFSEAVSDFSLGDVTIGGTANPSAVAVQTIDASHYTVIVSGMTQSGTVTASLASGIAHDTVGIASSASTSTDNTVTYNFTVPAVTINQGAGQGDPTGGSPVVFDVLFSETVTGFDAADITLGGTAGATTAVVTPGIDAAHYTVSVSGMTTSGTVIATIGAGAAQDSNSHASTASTSVDNTVTYTFTVPSVTINQGAGQGDPTGGSPVVFDVVFSETVTGFDAADITLTGTAGATTAVVTPGVDAAHYTVSVSGMTTSGTVIATIGAGAAQDSNSHASTASTSVDNTVQFNVAAIPPTANNDDFATTETTAIGAGLNVFNNNGHGADVDPDSPSFTVSTVNGSAANVGTAITLASGAKVTLNANGTFSYDPNHAFDLLPAAGSGATNLTATDTFTYTDSDGVLGSGTATVTVTISGVDSNDLLQGSFAAGTTLTGGIGNDTYVVHNTATTVNDATGALDVVYAEGVSYSLAASATGIEAMIIEHGTGITGTGYSAAANTLFSQSGVGESITLIGGSAADYLSGGLGTDSLQGGGGDDIYVVHATATAISDTAGTVDVAYVEGVNYALANGDGVDYAILENGTGHTLTGHTTASSTLYSVDTAGQSNTLIGGSAADVLVGSLGTDHLQGGGGDDSYVVFSAGTTVTDTGGATDIVYAEGVNWALTDGDGIEDLVVEGSGHTATGHTTQTTAIYSTGTGNTLVGGSAQDILNAGAHGDTLIGNGGNDFLIAGAGNDVLQFGTGFGQDIVYNFHPHDGGGNQDTIRLTGEAPGTTFASMVANHLIFESPDASQSSGTDVVVEHDANNYVVLLNHHLADLSASDFLFA